MQTATTPKWLPSHLAVNFPCLAVAFSASKKELAKVVCRPATQNVAGHNEFIKGHEAGNKGWCTQGRTRSELVLEIALKLSVTIYYVIPFAND